MAGVLAIDQATLSGWAWGKLPVQPLTPLEAMAVKPPKPLSGVKRIGPKGCSIGRFLIEAEAWLNAMIDQHQPAGIIYERAILDPKLTGYDTALKLMGLAGTIEKVAAQRGISWVRGAQPSSVKKHFCGSGRPGKEGIKEACLARGWVHQDDNEADALALLDYAAHLYAQERAAA